jgi:hypothetical protein
MAIFNAMTIRQIKKEVEALSPKEQRELATYIVRLQNARDPGYKRLLAQWRDDRDRSHWLTLDEAEKRLKKN